MANPKKLDAQQHETFPGTGPNGASLGRATDGASGLHPVEQMVDAAIDRMARDYQNTRVVQTHALAVRTAMQGAAGPLRWKGIDVTEEFRAYAERVAAGENLPPYAGKILTESHPDFLWEPGTRRKASRGARSLQAALWGTAITIAGLIVWSIAVKFSTPQPSASAPLAERSSGEGVVPSQRPTALPRANAPLEPKSFDPTGSRDQGTFVGANTLSPGGEVIPAAPSQAATGPQSREAAQEPGSAARAYRFRPSTRAATQSTSNMPASAPELAPAGSLREALGALLAARGAPDEVPSSTPHAPPPPGSDPSNASAAPNQTQASASQGTASGAAPDRHTSAAAVESVNAGPVGKEPGGTPSGKGSLLVETPSF